MKFCSENRTNGLSYIVVMDGEKQAGAFSVDTEAWKKLKQSLNAGKIEVAESGLLTEALPTKARKPRTKATVTEAEPVTESATPGSGPEAEPEAEPTAAAEL